MIEVPRLPEESNAAALARYCEERDIEPETLVGERFVFTPVQAGWRAPITPCAGYSRSGSSRGQAARQELLWSADFPINRRGRW
jgi:hypothetical protein